MTGSWGRQLEEAFELYTTSSECFTTKECAVYAWAN
jgi:hypothetical protein